MKEILCFGDSNTYGLIPGTKQRYEFDKRWTGILQRRLFSNGYLFVEEGLCGRTTVFEDELRDMRKGSDMLPALLESHSTVETVVIMLGTNDCKSCYHASAEGIGLGIEKLLDQIKTFDERIKVLLISPILLGEYVYRTEYDPEFDRQSVETSKGLKEVYEKIAKKREVYFLAASDIAKASETDQEHMDEEGHRKLADAIYHMLGKIQ